MGSGGIGDKFFSVKVVADHCFLDSFFEPEYEEALPLIEVCEAFESKSAEEIARRCRDALAGKPDYAAFSVNLSAENWYIMALLHADGNTVYFNARSVAHIGKQTAYGQDVIARYLGTLSQSSDSGLCIWRVTHDAQFVLTYANPSLESLLGLGAVSCGKLPCDIFSPAEASYMLTHLSDCFIAKKPVTFTLNRGACLLSIKLVPATKNAPVESIFGTIHDITPTILNSSEIENMIQRSQHSDRQLCTRVAFSEMLSTLTCDLLDAGQIGFDDCMTRLSESIGRIMGVDYVSIVKCSDPSHTVEYEWKAHIKYRSLGTVMFRAAEKHMRQGRMLICSEVKKDLADSRHPMSHAILPSGICSLLGIPVLRDGEVFGTICLGQYSHSRLWTTNEITLIKTAAHTIMSAYLRIKTEISLYEANQILVEYDESLQDMLEIEETISKVSQSFIMSDTAHFDQCVSSLLGDVCALFEMDAAFLCINDVKKKDVIYQWSRRGFPHFCHRFKYYKSDSPLWSGIPCQPIAIDNMLEGHIPLPPQIRDNMVDAGVKSLLCVSICCDDKVIGLLMLSKIVGWHKWSAVQIDAAKTFADIFQGAYRRNEKAQYPSAQNPAQTDLWKKATAHMQWLTEACADTLTSCFIGICKEYAESFQFESVCITRDHQSRSKKLLEWNAKEHKKKNQNSSCKIYRIPLSHENKAWGCLHVRLLSDHLATGEEMMRLFAQAFVSVYMRTFPSTLAKTKVYFLEAQPKLEPKPLTV